MARTQIFIVCSPHARTGVSMLTRLLCDYHKVEARPFALFDTDPHSRTLLDLFPEACVSADLGTTRGQIALFDRLVANDGAIRIVEVCSQNYTRFFRQVRDIGLIEEASRLDLEPVILFVSNGTMIAVEAARALRDVWRGTSVIPVVNESRTRLGPDIFDHLDAFGCGDTFQIPALDVSARDTIEEPGFSLSGFLTAPPDDGMSLVVRADLRSWLTRVFTQFRSYELRKAFSESNYLLKA